MADASGPRRLTHAMWGPPTDPRVLADISIDAQPMLDVIQAEADAGHRITPTAMVLAGCGRLMVEVPEAIVVLRNGRWVPRGDHAGTLVTSDEQGHMTTLLLEDLHVLSVRQIQARVDAASQRRPSKERDRLRRFYRGFTRLPRPLMRLGMRLSEKMAYDWGRRLPGTRIGPGGWGAFSLSNMGALGVPDLSYAPIPSYTRLPIVLSMGAIHKAPLVRGDQVVAGPKLPLTAVLDHRAYAPQHFARLAISMRKSLEDPVRLESYRQEPRDPEAG